MEKKSKKSIVIGITSLLLVTLTLLGLTYAYYRTKINGNNADKSISVTSKKLGVIYLDGSETFSPTEKGELITPGFTYTKEFKVQNTGDEAVSYSIKFDNIVNEYTKGTGADSIAKREAYNDWSYVLIKEGVADPVAQGEVTTIASEQIIVESVSIEAGTKDNPSIDEYSLTITYANLEDIDQSDDMGSEFSLRVNIGDPISSSSSATNEAWENATQGTLLYALRNNNEVSEPLTVPGEEVSKVTYNIIDETEEGSVMLASMYSYGWDPWSYGDTAETANNMDNNVTSVINDCANSLKGKYIYDRNGEYANVKDALYVQDCTEDNVPIVNVEYEYESILALTEDDDGLTYYFRGAEVNNYVNYAGMCWRIVRVQGNGGIKLILDDKNTTCDDTETTTSTKVYSGDYTIGEGPYGYTYGYVTDSSGTQSTKQTYVENLLGEDSTYMINSMRTWLNNSTIDINDLLENDWCYNNVFEDAGNKNDLRVQSVNNESAISFEYKHEIGGTLKCTEERLNTFKSYIATLTADEIVFAGDIHKFGSSDYNVLPQCYLYDINNTSWHTLSLHDFRGYANGDTTYVVSADGDAPGLTTFFYHVNNTYGFRPSIVLKSSAIISKGTGTQSDPYVIS